MGSSSPDSPAAPVLPKAAERRQVPGGGAPRSAAAASSLWMRSRGLAGKPRRAAAPSSAAKVAEPERGLARRSRARELRVWTRERRAREEPPRGVRASGEGTEGA